MSLESGFVLGPYVIRSHLGKGGMGEVYRATDSRLGRDVAVKVLPERLIANREALKRFEREAKTLAALSLIISLSPSSPHPPSCTISSSPVTNSPSWISVVCNNAKKLFDL